MTDVDIDEFRMGRRPFARHCWLAGVAVTAWLVACNPEAGKSGHFEATVSGSGVQYRLMGEAALDNSQPSRPLRILLRDRTTPTRVVTLALTAPVKGVHPIGPGVLLDYASDGSTAFVAESGEIRLASLEERRAEGAFRATLRLASGEPTAFVVEGSFEAVSIPPRMAP